MGTRPPQVSRLPLGGGSGGKEEGRRLSGPGSSTGLRPPLARLNLAQLQRADSEENRSPLSARSGATPRSARRASPGSSTNWLVDASDSDVGSPAQDCSPAGQAERESAAAAAAEPGGEADAAEEEAEVVQQMATLSPPRPLSSRGPPPPRPGVAAPAAGGRPGVPRLSLAGGARPSQPAAPQQQARASTSSAPGRRLSQVRCLGWHGATFGVHNVLCCRVP